MPSQCQALAEPDRTHNLWLHVGFQLSEISALLPPAHFIYQVNDFDQLTASLGAIGRPIEGSFPRHRLIISTEFTV